MNQNELVDVRGTSNMSDGSAALFYLGSHNEVDQISPILYKLGERDNITVDVVLEGGISAKDYRIQAVSQHDNITIAGQKTTDSQFSMKDYAIELVKDAGRKAPSNIPEKIYQRFIQSSDQIRIPNGFSDKDYGVIAFDWTHAKSQRTSVFADREDIVTIVLPHGDSPFVNRLETKDLFKNFISYELNFEKQIELDEFSYQSHKKFLKHDYVLFPNDLTASRMPDSASDNQTKVLGSPRYNDEWLDILSEIRPESRLSSNSKLNAVFFSRLKKYFVSVDEVLNTLELLNQFNDFSTIVKEHPRARLLHPTAADEMENIEIIKDQIPSESLIEWGDIFLSLGTTITFEPIMCKKPVLAIEYAHANHTVVSNYFSEADIRSKDALYNTIHEFLQHGTSDFYHKHSHQTFVDEMVSPKGDSVLDSWAEFIELQAQ